MWRVIGPHRHTAGLVGLWLLEVAGGEAVYAIYLKERAEEETGQ
jgi:hypothetical protein